MDPAASPIDSARRARRRDRSLVGRAARWRLRRRAIARRRASDARTRRRAGAVGRRRRIPRSPVAHHDAGRLTGDDEVSRRTDEDAWTFEPEPQPSRRLGVDPLLARLGGLAVIVTLAAPLVVGFASSAVRRGRFRRVRWPRSLVRRRSSLPIDGDDRDGSAAPCRALRTLRTPTPAHDGSMRLPASPQRPRHPPIPTSTTRPRCESAEAAPLEATPSGDPERAPTGSWQPHRHAAIGTTVAAGDYWIRIADAADVSLADLLAVNDASVDTVLVPGGSICLPVGASTPAPTDHGGAARHAPSLIEHHRHASRPTANHGRASSDTTAPSRPAAVPAVAGRVRSSAMCGPTTSKSGPSRSRGARATIGPT